MRIIDFWVRAQSEVGQECALIWVNANGGGKQVPQP